MRCTIRVINFSTKASDSSQISEEVCRQYLNTKEAQEDLEAHRMIGSLTHRVRNVAALGYAPEVTANLKKTVSKDDGLLLIDSNCPPTHYIDKLWIENGSLWAELQIFDEEGFDDQAVQAIRRLKSLLKYSKIGISAIILGFWSGQKDGVDRLERLVKLKGVDFTTTPSFPGSYVTKVMDDNGEEIKTFSDTAEVPVATSGFDGYKVKTFSSISEFGVSAPKTSKVNNQFSILKAKSFSMIEDCVILNEEAPAATEQKEFSAVHVQERVRLSKLSIRAKFRRLILDYRAALKASKGDEATLKVMKSLFSTDLLGILQELTPQVLAGKNLTALLGAGAISMEVRKATQELMIPYRLALLESKRQGFVSKARYQKIQDAYTNFVRSILSYVFDTPTSQKLAEEETPEKEEVK